MADIFRSNRDAFRGAILFQIKLKVSVEEAFKSAKMVLEDDELDFVEFEYMYYKLYEDPLANFSADFTNKAPYCKLENFPPEVLEKIVHDLDPMDQLRVRKVAKCFRIATLKAPCKYYKLEIEQWFNRVRVNFNGVLVIYKAYKPQGCIVSSCFKRTVFPNENYFDMASMDLNVILSNPNFCTGYFFIELHNESLGTEKTVLTTMENTITDCNLKFTARELNVSVKDGQHLRQIGNMFNTTALEKVTVKFDSFKTTLNLDILSQFEQLKSIGIKSYSFCEMNSFELFAKCENLDMECRVHGRDIPNIVNQILVSDKFKSGCMYSTHSDVEVSKTFFPDAIISGDTWYLKFKNIPFWLKLQKKTRSQIMFLERCTEDDLP